MLGPSLVYRFVHELACRSANLPKSIPSKGMKIKPLLFYLGLDPTVEVLKKVSQL